MTEREVWKERYALKPRTGGGELAYAHGLSNDLVYHHEHPRIVGVAHCRIPWVLDMTTLLDAHPVNDRYCQRCKLVELNWKARADGESFDKSEK